MHAAANLFQRAAALLAEDDPQRAELLPELGETLMGLGDFAGARTVVRRGPRRVPIGSANQRLKASSQLDRNVLPPVQRRAGGLERGGAADGP